MTIAERLFLYEGDCAEFAKHIFRLDVSDPRIVEFLNSRVSELLVLFSRQVGKTTGGAVRVVHKAIFEPKTLSVIVSATQRQAGILQSRVLGFMRQLHRSETWHEVPGQFAEIPESIEQATHLVRCSTLSLELANGSEVVSVPASPETVRGYSPNLIIMDEAAYTPDRVYLAVRPMRIRTKAQLIVMSTAGVQRGFFYEAWAKEQEWQKITAKANEFSWITAEELEKERRKFPPAFFRAEYENEFMPIEGSIFTREMIEQMTVMDTKVDTIAKPWLPGDLGA